jgi:hypothetical protein
VNRLVNAYRSRKLALQLRLGLVHLGRQDSASAGATVKVPVPVRARMSAKVIRADGTVEDLGVIGEELTEVPQEYLDELARQAGG